MWVSDVRGSYNGNANQFESDDQTKCGTRSFVGISITFAFDGSETRSTSVIDIKSGFFAFSGWALNKMRTPNFLSGETSRISSEAPCSWARWTWNGTVRLTSRKKDRSVFKRP